MDWCSCCCFMPTLRLSHHYSFYHKRKLQQFLYFLKVLNWWQVLRLQGTNLRKFKQWSFFSGRVKLNSSSRWVFVLFWLPIHIFIYLGGPTDVNVNPCKLSLFYGDKLLYLHSAITWSDMKIKLNTTINRPILGRSSPLQQQQLGTIY